MVLQDALQLACCLAAWPIRYMFDGHRARQDAQLIVLMSIFQYFFGSLRKASETQASIFMVSLLLCAGAFVIVDSIARKIWGSSTGMNEPGVEGKYTFPDPPLQPLIFPCRTSHTRRFPKQNSFSYSYLYVGIPIGWTGSVASVISAEVSNPAWFHVDATNYLERGDGHLGLKGKLHDYLKAQVCFSK